MEENLFSTDNCKALEPKVGLPCIFCGTDKSNEFSLGKLIHQEGFTVHYYCMLFSCGLAQQNDIDIGILGFCYSDLRKEYLRGRRLSCFYCKKRGATVGCCFKQCRRGFHLSCGQKNGTLHQFFGMFLSYCDKHRLVQNITAKQSKKPCLCPICFESVENKASGNTLWASCCNSSWFHRDCIQMQALSAGYFFKCPLCNNCEDFKSEMEIYGIYIPEKDAAWELVENAYDDLLFRYSHCDLPCCLCPKGRNYSNDSQWEIVLCNICGSAGCHRECGLLTLYTTIWQCNDCQLITQRSEQNDKVLKPTRQIRSRRILSAKGVEGTLRKDLNCSNSTVQHQSENKEVVAELGTGTSNSSSEENNSNSHPGCDGTVNKQDKLYRSKERSPKRKDIVNQAALSDDPPKLEICVPRAPSTASSWSTAVLKMDSQA